MPAIYARSAENKSRSRVNCFYFGFLVYVNVDPRVKWVRHQQLGTREPKVKSFAGAAIIVGYTAIISGRISEVGTGC